MVMKEKDNGMLGLFIALLILALLTWLWLQQRIAQISTEDAERSMTDAEQKAEELKEAAKSQLGSIKRAVPIQSVEPETTPEPEAGVTISVSAPETTPEPTPVPVESVTAVIDAISEPEKASEPETMPASTPETGDDLQRIEGIGPKYAEILLAAGITSYAQIARMSEDQILDVIRAGGGRKSASMATWAEQAQLAAQGDWEALAALQKSLSGGRRDE